MSDDFAALMRSAEDGEFVDAAGVKLTDALRTLRAHAEKTNLRAKGKIIVSFDLEMDPKGVLETKGKIDTKLPVENRPRSIHWTSEDGSILNRRPERQLELTGIKGGVDTSTPSPKTNIKSI